MAKSKAKTNGEAHLPVVFAPRDALNVGQLDAYEQAMKDGSAEYLGQQITAVEDGVYKGVVIHDNHTDYLLVGIPRKGEPPFDWRAVARYDEREHAGVHYIEGKFVQLDLGARWLAAATCAVGHDGLALYNLDENHINAEPVALEGAVHIRLASGSTVLRVRHRDLWWGVTRFSKVEALPAREPDPPGGRAFPRLPIA